MSAIPFGVIGVGHLGAVHARLAAGLPEFKLIGVFDVDAARCQEVASACSCQAYSSLASLLEDVLAVSIVVPTEHHFHVAEQAVKQGCHLFVEKPVTTNSHQAQRLLAQTQEADRILQVGHIERFNPAFKALEGYCLQPMFIESHRLSQFNPRGLDVSVVLDLMIHDIDIVLSLIDAPLDSIQACGVGVVSENEDIANARLEFANGAVANLTASRISAKDMRKMRLFQQNSYLAVDFLKQKTEILHLSQHKVSPDQAAHCIGDIGVGDQVKSIYLHTPEPVACNALEEELKSFAHSIAHTARPVVSGQDGLRALKTAELILQEMNARQELAANKKAGL